MIRRVSRVTQENLRRRDFKLRHYLSPTILDILAGPLYIAHFPPDTGSGLPMSIASSAPSPRRDPTPRARLSLRSLSLIPLDRPIPGLLLAGPIE